MEKNSADLIRSHLDKSSAWASNLRSLGQLLAKLLNYTSTFHNCPSITHRGFLKRSVLAPGARILTFA